MEGTAAHVTNCQLINGSTRCDCRCFTGRLIRRAHRRILLGNNDCVFLRLHSIVNLPRRSSLALHSAVSEPESRHFSRCRTANVAAAPCPYPASGAASRNIEPCNVSTTIVSTAKFLRRVSPSSASRYRLLPSYLANILGIGTVKYFVPALLRLLTRWSA